MCFQLVELYAQCRCLYYQHAVDRCASYGRHNIQKRTILVGYACSEHTPRASASGYGTYDYAQPQGYSDSGYHSTSRSSKGSSSRGSSSHYR